MHWVNTDDPEFTVLKIENISKEYMINTVVKLIYRQNISSEKPDKLEWFIIKRIDPYKTFLYVPKGSQTSTNDADNIKFVDLWVTTETGETVNFRMMDNYNNGLFNPIAVISDIDSPNGSNFSDRPPRNEYDGIVKNTSYDHSDPMHVV